MAQESENGQGGDGKAETGRKSSGARRVGMLTVVLLLVEAVAIGGGFMLFTSPSEVEAEGMALDLDMPEYEVMLEEVRLALLRTKAMVRRVRAVVGLHVYLVDVKLVGGVAVAAAVRLAPADMLSLPVPDVLSGARDLFYAPHKWRRRHARLASAARSATRRGL